MRNLVVILSFLAILSIGATAWADCAAFAGDIAAVVLPSRGMLRTPVRKGTAVLPAGQTVSRTVAVDATRVRAAALPCPLGHTVRIAILNPLDGSELCSGTSRGDPERALTWIGSDVSIEERLYPVASCSAGMPEGLAFVTVKVTMVKANRAGSSIAWSLYDR